MRPATPLFRALRVLPLAIASAFALFTLTAPAAAQLGGAGIVCRATADTHVVSVSAGGTQTIRVRTDGLPPGTTGYRVLGSFSGTTNGTWFFNTLVPLKIDRYFMRIYSVGSPFVPGGNQGLLDANGDTVVRIVIPPGAPSWLVGRTMHHAIVPQQLLFQQPYCSSRAIRLTFVP